MSAKPKRVFRVNINTKGPDHRKNRPESDCYLLCARNEKQAREIVHDTLKVGTINEIWEETLFDAPTKGRLYKLTSADLDRYWKSAHGNRHTIALHEEQYV